MNVLVLSASSKVLLVRSFQRAVAAAGGIVVAADIVPDAAALHVADRAVLLPRSSSAEFPGALEAVCEAFDIGLVVPTRDGELMAVADCVPALESLGIKVLAPSAETVAVCCDTRRFMAFCRRNGFPYPATLAEGVRPDRFPVFCRAADRTVEHAAMRIEGAEAFDAYMTLYGSVAGGVVVQEFIAAPEYSIDVLMDLDGRPLQAVARRRIAVRAGESWKSRVERLPVLTDMALALSERLGLVGHNTLQAFYDEIEGVRFIEVNARFGGASNLSIQAGLASPERIVQMASGHTAAAAAPRPVAHGQMLLRHGDDVIVAQDPALACVPWTDLVQAEERDGRAGAS